MEFRKLQIVGGKTYSVNLPIEWIKKLELEKGDTLKIDEQDSGDLIIGPPVKKTEEKPKIYRIVSSHSLR
ncbi:MAG: AbrB/MazE/SpoVT family DNA-binding domain-containing protein, partial [Candidatus Lokiarchaeota archaeon]|nr:AbrB/MazE/SpoVT family DNA-binding domain-containing protein [Candidatus Lokiarchaeota archaeon]